MADRMTDRRYYDLTAAQRDRMEKIRCWNGASWPFIDPLDLRPEDGLLIVAAYTQGERKQHEAQAFFAIARNGKIVRYTSRPYPEPEEGAWALFTPARISGYNCERYVMAGDDALRWVAQTGREA